MTDKTYVKRPGTSGIRGQLYETKLISLIYFRAIHDNSIKQFHLATNVDKIGTFDDICFSATIKGYKRPLAVFLQAKHREHNKVVILNSENDLLNYFVSYLKIRNAFKSNNKNVLFEGSFKETECLFIVYTTAKDDFDNNMVKSNFSSKLNYLISTSATDSYKQSTCNSKDIQFLCSIVFKEEVTMLARQIVKLFYEKTQCHLLMNNEILLKYHVLLAQHVLNISDIQPGDVRYASFRQEFFNTFDNKLLLLKESLYTEILKKRKYEKNEIIELLTNLFDAPSRITLSKLIGSVITYKHGRLFFINNVIENFRQQLYDLLVSSYMVEEAFELAAKEILISRRFKVASVFGNKDLAIRGRDDRIEKRLRHLTSIMVDLMKKSKPNNIVTIEESMEVGFLRLNGGLASSIGNLLVLDGNSKLIKFTDNLKSLGNLAKRLHEKLQSQIHDLDVYRFDISVDNFPKLSFTCGYQDENMARDFLSKLIFYTQQADENHVEEILKCEIEDLECNELNNFQVKSDAVFLLYHDEIQKWWMVPKRASYLTKESKVYEDCVRYINNKPLTTLLHTMFFTKKKPLYFYIAFSKNAIKSLNLHIRPLRTIIVTKSSVLTTIKVLQYFRNKDHAILDLNYIVNLPAIDFNTLCKELTNKNRKKIFIIICNEIINNRRLSTKLRTIANNIHGKNIIVITEKKNVDEAKKYFTGITNVIEDERNGLIDLTDESQNDVLKEFEVNFQGFYFSLNSILDEVSKSFVENSVLFKLVIEEVLPRLGKSVIDSNYEKIEYYYIDRCLSISELETKKHVENSFIIENYKYGLPIYTKSVGKRYKFHGNIHTLNDITDDVVLIIANPGMGKTTLLSSLSINTKDPEVWIIRTNLLEYSKEFNMWQANETVIDTLESLKFMCHVTLSDEHSKVNKVTINLEESNGTVLLKDCTGDEMTVFELKMFLHYFNNKQVIFLFDGFDEICPHYAQEVLKLLKTVSSYPRKHRMWITSRSYENINSILEMQFGKYYEIEPLSDLEQSIYLYLFWCKMKILKNLNDDQYENIYDFITFMSENNDLKCLLKKNELPMTSKKEMPLLIVYFSFLDYLKSNLKFAPANVIDALTTYLDKLEAYKKVHDLIAIPLHLQLTAEYFYDLIKHVSKKPNKWNLDTNIFKIYESFLETKLKKIRFEEKNKIDMYNPDNILTYNKERFELVSKHKRMAAYAVFHRNSDKLFSENELSELLNMIEIIKEGEEKTGIICNVVNGIPVFVHRTFAEYFAVEHICDQLKIQSRYISDKSILDFILNFIFFNCNYNILDILETKFKIDKELATVVEKHKTWIFEILLQQGQNTKGEIKSSLYEAIRNNLRNLVTLFLTTIEENLNNSNLIDFIKLVNDTNMLILAVKMEFEEFITSVVECIRRLDQTKLVLLFENIENFNITVNISEVSSDELVHRLHVHVWQRMGIILDWDNLTELSGQIHFI